MHVQIEQGVNERKGSSWKEQFPLVFPLKGTKSLQTLALENQVLFAQVKKRTRRDSNDQPT